MPRWYMRKLKDSWAIDENTTNRFWLPDRGKLSALLIQMQTTNEADMASYDDPYPVQRSTIRILGNGAHEIVNCRARQLHAMNFWDRGRMPREGLDTIDTVQQVQFLYIPFGQFVGDKKHGLTLEDWDSGVEFEETNNISTTYYQDGKTLYTIWGLMRYEPEADLFAGGYFRRRQVFNKICASEAEYDVKLPTENRIRQIHLFSEPTQTSGVLAATVFNTVYKIWLSTKTGERLILDNMPSDQWARFIHDYFGREAHTIVRLQTASGGGYHDSMIYEKRNSALQHLQASAYFAVGDATTDQTRMQRIYSYLHDGTAADSRYTMMQTWGICLHGDIPLLLTKPEDPETEFLDAKAEAEVHLKVTENTSSGKWYVVLDELETTVPK